jgi:hypothetical protein
VVDVFDALEQQAGLVHDVAATFVHLTSAPGGAPEVEKRLREAEENAARAAAEIERLLQHAYTLQIDREDVQGLSAALRSELGLAARAVRTGLAVGAGSSEPIQRLAEMIAESTGGVARAVDRLRTYDYAAVFGIARELRALQRSARFAHDEAIASLLERHDVLGQEGMLREVLVLEHLKQTIHRSRDIIGLLSYVAVKNS